MHCSELQPASLHTGSSKQPCRDSTDWWRSAGVTHAVPPQGTHVPPMRMPCGAWCPPVRVAISTGEGRLTALDPSITELKGIWQRHPGSSLCRQHRASRDPRDPTVFARSDLAGLYTARRDSEQRTHAETLSLFTDAVRVYVRTYSNSPTTGEIASSSASFNPRSLLRRRPHRPASVCWERRAKIGFGGGHARVVSCAL